MSSGGQFGPAPRCLFFRESLIRSSPNRSAFAVSSSARVNETGDEAKFFRDEDGAVLEVRPRVPCAGDEITRLPLDPIHNQGHATTTQRDQGSVRDGGHHVRARGGS